MQSTVGPLVPTLAVIVAVPGAFAVTLPLSSTVATDPSLGVIDQVTVGSLAQLGFHESTDNVSVPPTVKAVSVLLSVISVIVVFSFTVTLQLSVFD